MLKMYSLINKYAAKKSDILILGENGVGKELVGSILHYNGPQSNEPFIKIDCGSQLDFLMEREIFGYDKNAFEGAMHNFKGAFEQAEGGTLYFENIEELSEEIQSKFLRVLKERSFERVGGSKTLKADVRIIVASDKDLKYLVEEGTLIKELFSKLTENVIKVPALRERNNDIITLAESFINRFSSKLNKEIKRISTPVQEMLMSYSWPGNVRELETVIERAVILTEDNVIHAYDLPLSLQTPILSSTSFKKGLVAKLDSIEYEMIIEALKNHKGNISTAAEDLGLSRRMLSLRMDKFNIVYKKYRGE